MQPQSRVTREQLIEQSVNAYVQAGLDTRGYPTNTYKLVESYPYGLQTLDDNLIAAGFTFDDGGKAFEIGSNMKERKYTVEYFVFAKTATWGQSLSNAIKFSIEQDLVIPLLDITQPQPWPQIDILYVDNVHARREVITDPEPWQEFTYYVSTTLTDYYTPALT